jgi:hypothetical protein
VVDLITAATDAADNPFSPGRPIEAREHDIL